MKEDKTKEELRSLIEQGKELGYILTSSLNNVISLHSRVIAYVQLLGFITILWCSVAHYNELRSR